MAFLNMVQQSRKTIVVTEQIFDILRGMGNVTESFNDVITRLIVQNQKAMSGQQPLVGSAGQDTAAPQSTVGAAESSNG
jgi:hypothetical protein